jgi:hypothetical protein
MSEWTSIRISRTLHAELSSLGKKNETYDQTISRLITPNVEVKTLRQKIDEQPTGDT